MRISDWSSDVCSSGLCLFAFGLGAMWNRGPNRGIGPSNHVERVQFRKTSRTSDQDQPPSPSNALDCFVQDPPPPPHAHTLPVRAHPGGPPPIPTHPHHTPPTTLTTTPPLTHNL